MNGNATGTTVLRPEVEQYRRWLRRGDPILIAFLGVALARVVFDVNSLTDAVITAVLIVGAAGLALGGSVWSIRTTSVRLSPGRIEFRQWRLRRIVLDLDVGVQGLLALYAPPATTRESDLLVLRARCGGPRIRLFGGSWQHDDLVTIANHAGADVFDRPLSLRDIDKRAPKIMYWYERHMFLTIVLGSVLLIALIIGSIVLYDAVAR